jgi:large subunit ribosomal protein L21
MLRRIVFGLAGLFIAWLVFLRPRHPLIYIPDSGQQARRKAGPESNAPAEQAAPSAGEPAAAPAKAPARKVPARKTPPIVPDDLTLLDGIGPKIAAALVAAGVDSFAKLANAVPENLERIVREAGVRMVGHADSWLRQAKLAASGDMDGLARLQAELRTRRRGPGEE